MKHTADAKLWAVSNADKQRLKAEMKKKAEVPCSEEEVLRQIRLF